MKTLSVFVFILCLASCASKKQVDVLIVNGQVYDGSGTEARALDIGLCGETICAISEAGTVSYLA